MDLSFNSVMNLAKAVVGPAPVPAEAALAQVVAPPPPPPAAPAAQPAGLTLPTAATSLAAVKAEAAKIWAGGPFTGQAQGVQVEGTYNPIQAPGVDNAKDLQAVNQIFANHDMEQAELAQLPAEDRKRYEDLAHLFDHDPQAHLALQVALLDGKFGKDPAKNPPNADGKKTLEALDALSKQQAAPPANFGQLTAEVVRNIAEPGTIKQGNTNCCAAASLQVTMATNQPAEYARLVAGLSKADGGSVTLQGRAPDGSSLTVRRVDNWSANEKPGAGPGRTLTDRLFQNSMMDAGAKLANPANHYDPVQQAVVGPNGTDPNGLTFSGAGPLSVMTQGGNVKLDNVNALQEKQLRAMFADMQNGNQPSVEIGTGYDAEGVPHGQPLRGKLVAHQNGQFVLQTTDGRTVKLDDKDLGVRLLKCTSPAAPYDRSTVGNQAYADMKASLNAKQQPTVMLRWGTMNGDGQAVFGGAKDPYHYVMVDRIENNRVYFKNTQTGTMDSMSEQEFRNRMCNVAAKV